MRRNPVSSRCESYLDPLANARIEEALKKNSDLGHNLPS